MKTVRCMLLALCLVAASATGCGPAAPGTLYQYSTIGALLEGAYDGELTCARLLRHGDFGLGTFNGLDGEMIVVDRKVYKVGTDGKAVGVRDNERTPFAMVTTFKPNMIFVIDHNKPQLTLEKLVAQKVPDSNLPQAIRLDGEFNYVKVRSVPKQKSKPYPRLADVVKKQAVFELRGVRGTIAGFCTPAYMSGISVPGCHFHFITEDRSRGGHVLACRPGNVVLKIQEIYRMRLDLPQTDDFLSAQLGGDRPGELQTVEK